MPKFHLVLLIHGHQPVGNFDSVFEETYQRSYLPFVEHLARHPAVRLGFHFSGPLLEWFEQHHPEFLDRLREMAERRQVEMVGGGFYEPILISIPPEDQAEQLGRMREYLVQKFGHAPSGAWLAERVWEPQLPHVLASSDVQYTLVDDVHFLAAGFDPDQLHGDYIAEDRGQTVRVFPGLKMLRYLLPFRAPHEAITFLRDSAARHPGGMAAMGDDCEKFGAWPGTYEHCYRNGWVEQFFTALEASADWLSITPPGEYAAAHAPLGRADLPTASYTEMMEWVLPTAARNAFHAVNEEFASRPDVLRFMHGGQWRGFFSKYAEANLLHMKMLHVSERLRRRARRKFGPARSASLARARTHVLRAQCNDAYWHGIFGGVYAPHLRTELWRELVRAESLAGQIASPSADSISVERCDFDADGSEELYVTSRRMAALVHPADGGTIGALDFRPTEVTLINSMQRRPEAYHNRLHERSLASSEGIASIHDRVLSKEEGLERFLHYDRWPRKTFRVLLFAAEKTFDDYQQLRLDEHAALAGGAYAVRQDGPERVRLVCETPFAAEGGADAREFLRCTKDFLFAHEDSGYQIDCATEISSAGAQPRAMQLGIELVVNLLAPDEPNRYFEAAAERHPLRWTAAIPSSESRLRIVDEWQNVAVSIEAPGANQIWIAPIETVSESEDGFERVYQGSQILILWPVELAVGSVWRGEVTLRVAPAHPIRTESRRRSPIKQN